MSPGFKFDIAHILSGRSNRSLVYRIATWVGSDRKVRPNSVLIMPLTRDLNVEASRPFPSAQAPFNMMFGSIPVRAYWHNFGPPSAILLDSPLFTTHVCEGNKSDQRRFNQIFAFSRSVIGVLNVLGAPIPKIFCHGAETGLVPYLVRPNGLKDAEVMFTIYDKNPGLFGKGLFENKKVFERLLSLGTSVYYGDEISLSKVGVFFSNTAFAHTEQLLNDLIPSDADAANFFKSMRMRGRLNPLLGGAQSRLSVPEQAKMIVDLAAKTAKTLTPYSLATVLSNSFLARDDVSLLVHTSENAPKDYSLKLSSVLKRRLSGPFLDKVFVDIRGFEGPFGSGSAIIHMLAKAAKLEAKYKAIKWPVIHLSVGTEKKIIGKTGISFAEIAARTAGFIADQLPTKEDLEVKKNGNGGNGNGKTDQDYQWTIIAGNTVLFLPDGKLMAGRSLLKDAKAGIVVFARPYDLNKIAQGELNGLSEWGAVFADKVTGSVFTIKEKPSSVDEVRQGAAIGMGGVNLSVYAIRGDVRETMLKEYAGVGSGHFSSLSDKYALHFVRHILEPMALNKKDINEWTARWNNTIRDEKGSIITKEDWVALFQIAQGIKEKYGGVVMAHSTGSFYDLRIQNAPDEKKLLNDLVLVNPLRAFFGFTEIKAHEPLLLPEVPKQAPPKAHEDDTIDLVPEEVARMPAPSPRIREEDIKEEGVQYIELAPEPKVQNVRDVHELLSDPRLTKAFSLANVNSDDIFVHGELMNNAAEVRKMNNIELSYFAQILRFKQIIKTVLGGAKHIDHYLVKQALSERKLLGEMEELTEGMMRDIAQDLKKPLIRALGGFTRSSAVIGADLYSKILSSIPGDVYDRMSVEDVIGFIKKTEELIKRKFATGKPQEAMYSSMFLFAVKAGSPARSAQDLSGKVDTLSKKVTARMDASTAENITLSWGFEWMDSFVLVSHIAEMPGDDRF
jgi:hypothetical protein